ncbi:alpha-hydroxy acid oxidase [Novosphingobium lentum]|uniref:alpha-hydroxy acid oxidase n=1 Tax=Novosphingobium lentum TaxID=145287 RepID=UPI00083692B9|nr:alpha-hydroxy acid oxidase [Novosphingobium lentum]
MALRHCHNASDFEVAARRRLPKPLFDYVAGGADDETTKRANVAAFDRYQLVPRYLQDIREIDLRRTVLGCELAWPVILAPTGMSRMFHPDGECGVASAAEAAGVGYALSTMASASIEAIAQVSRGPKIYQLYLLADDGLNFAAIDRAKAAGYDAICLTVDTVVAGNRERDLRSGLTIPPRLGIGSLLQFARRPGWCRDHLLGGKFSMPNIAPPGAAATDISTLAAFFAQKMERHISWLRVQQLVRHWGGPFAIKGLQCAADAVLAAGHGVSAVIVSNHGGRQLDGTAATIDLVADIVDAADGRVEVILDGGVRRGTHVLKALAMGARACMIGRPYVYALAAFGQPGVVRLLELMRAETERGLALLGCSSVDQVGRRHLRLAAQVPAFLDERPISEPAIAQHQMHWTDR